ncbi:MAG: ABC transporter ATP-binding protein, partial [Planctomycetales bacterium]|nr:ABC transporter ATP-binding protein [Planctomycetales bacterium]
EVEVRALRGVDLQIWPGELAAIMGPSGSGKSTLMNIIGCLDAPTAGTYRLDGVDVSELSDVELAEIRCRKIGFVFQSFNLLSRTTARANVELPLIYAGRRGRQRRERAAEMLTLVGLGERLDHKPNELSGGQQQRVAIARALANNPAMILADEPTGNLDSENTEEVLRMLSEFCQGGGTVVVVTHGSEADEYADRQYRLHNGKLRDRGMFSESDDRETGKSPRH